MKYWIRELHFERFGYVLGEEPLPAPQPITLEHDEEAARLYGEQLYWEEYRERNEDDRAGKDQPGKRGPAAATTVTADEFWIVEGITDEDVPF